MGRAGAGEQERGGGNYTGKENTRGGGGGEAGTGRCSEFFKRTPAQDSDVNGVVVAVRAPFGNCATFFLCFSWVKRRRDVRTAAERSAATAGKVTQITAVSLAARIQRASVFMLDIVCS